MGCGHAEHGICTSPITIRSDTPIDDIVGMFYQERLSLLPVVDDNKKLVGVITRKNIIIAMAETGFWPEVEFQKRAA
jgi:CBS-domain-containing membrane protein